MQDYDAYSKALLMSSPAMQRFQSNVVIEGLRVGLEIAVEAPASGIKTGTKGKSAR
jgi:hypothetical protein